MSGAKFPKNLKIRSMPSRFGGHPRRRENGAKEWPMAKRKKRVFTPAFRAEAARLCKQGDRSIGQVAKDLDLTEGSLREWVKRAEAASVEAPNDALRDAERAELNELRKRVKRLEMEREILKKAAAFFAKENA